MLTAEVKYFIRFISSHKHIQGQAVEYGQGFRAPVGKHGQEYPSHDGDDRSCRELLAGHREDAERSHWIRKVESAESAQVLGTNAHTTHQTKARLAGKKVKPAALRSKRQHHAATSERRNAGPLAIPVEIDGARGSLPTHGDKLSVKTTDGPVSSF